MYVLELWVDFNATHGPGVVWTVVSEGTVQVGEQVIVSEPEEDLRFYGVVIDIRPAMAVGRVVIDVRVGPEWLSVV